MSGEADVWAMYSANIKNVFSGFSESSVDQHFLEFLKNNQVSKVYIAPDLDRTGTNWSYKVQDALRTTNIDLEIIQLPADLGDKR